MLLLLTFRTACAPSAFHELFIMEAGYATGAQAEVHMRAKPGCFSERVRS